MHENSILRQLIASAILTFTYHCISSALWEKYMCLFCVEMKFVFGISYDGKISYFSAVLGNVRSMKTEWNCTVYTGFVCMCMIVYYRENDNIARLIREEMSK